jgi:F0F1-type ATP synthase epsilon subunit
MAEALLRFTVQTPERTAFEAELVSLRLPTDSGQVGLRPRGEASLLAVEPGLVLAKTRDGLRFVATAGGLLRCDGRGATLLTPLAVTGESAQAVAQALDEALRAGRADLELHSLLQRLETGILVELRGGAALAPRGGRRG